jgi:hypothetical protein
MNEDVSRLPALDTDPSLAPDEGEEGRVAAVVEDGDGEGGAPITVIDRADRLAVEHGDALARDDEDEARALD